MWKAGLSPTKGTDLLPWRHLQLHPYTGIFHLARLSWNRGRLETARICGLVQRASTGGKFSCCQRKQSKSIGIQWKWWGEKALLRAEGTGKRKDSARKGWLTQLLPLASTWDWYHLAATHCFTSSQCATSSRTMVMTRHLQHPQHAPPCFKAASYRTGGKALNSSGRCFGGWFQSMTLIACLLTFPSAVA